MTAGGSTSMRVEPAPMTPAIAIVAGAASVTQGALAVVGLALLVGTFLLVAFQEIVGSISDPVDIVARASILGCGAVLTIGGLGELLRIALERTLRLRQARRLAAAGAPMPIAVERAAIARGAIGPSRIVLAIVAGVALTGALLGIGVGLSDDHLDAVLVGTVLLVVGAAAIAGRMLLGRRGPDRWSAAVDELGRAWPHLWQSTTVPPERRWGRGDRMLVHLSLAAFGVLLLGLFARQRCRTCEPVVYDPWGESVVDGIATIGLALAIVALVAIAMRLVVWLVRQAMREVRALRRLADGALERDAWLDAAMSTPRSLEWVGRVLGAVAMAALVLGIGGHADATFMSESEATLAPARAYRPLVPVSLVLVLVAVLVGALGAWQARTWRAALTSVLQHDPSTTDVRPRASSRRRSSQGTR